MATPLSIVLAEDDMVLADMYVKKFTMEGYDVRHAMDGEEALQLIREKKPNLLLMDLMMPRKNGLDTLKELRAEDQFKDLFVALLTNVGEQNYVDEGFRLGANQYLMKSNYTPREVSDKVKEWAAELGF